MTRLLVTLVLVPLAYLAVGVATAAYAFLRSRDPGAVSLVLPWPAFWLN